MLRKAYVSLPTMMGLLALAALQILIGCGVYSKDGLLLEYERTGGIAGLDDRLVIQADGAAVLTRRDKRAEFSMTPRELSALKHELEEADLPSLEGTYDPESPGYDLFEYVLVYKGHTVRASDGAIPEPLQSVIASLNGLVQAEH